MAVTVNMDRPLLTVEYSKKDTSINETSQNLPSSSNGHWSNSKFREFSESMFEIENLRVNQIERLQRSLAVDQFPQNVDITDPSLLPFLSPKVRAVVRAFPLQAEEIVKKHGLQSEEFNEMLKSAKTNPLFRWRVQKQVKKAHLIKKDTEKIYDEEDDR
jgi:hypothetical protein